MGPPRDRLQNLQAQAYFGDDDEYTIPIDDDDHGPMQKFFREIEDLREIVNQIDKVRCILDKSIAARLRALGCFFRGKIFVSLSMIPLRFGI